MTVKDKQRRFTAAIIDLDDTLYRSAEMPEEVKNNIQGACVSLVCRRLLTRLQMSCEICSSAQEYSQAPADV